MDEVSNDDLGTLIRTTEGPCVSIFMPTHRKGAEVQQDPIRLKNLLRDAEQQLVQQGTRSTDALEMLQPAQALVPDDLFWNHQAEGLALFAGREWWRAYRVPFPLEQLCAVSGRFLVKPLLRLFAGDGRFLILALSQNQVRLLEGTRYRVTPLPTAGLPASLADALRFDQPERQLQLHVGTTTGTGAIFHGQGTGTDDAKDAIKRYFQQVDRGLHALLRDRHAPLLLAGVEYLHPIFRDVSTYPHLLSKGLTGNPDRLAPEELHAQAWAIVGPHFEVEQQDALAAFRQYVGTGRASSDLATVVRAAIDGRVERLLVVGDAHAWGRVDPETSEAVLGGDVRSAQFDQDLLDLAAVETVLKGGRVYPVEAAVLADVGTVAGVFRY